jgi:dienelactone hydrolase
MRALGFALLVLAGCHHDAALKSPAYAATPTLAGTWAGTVDIPGQSLQIQIIFDDDKSGTIDIPQQGATNLALSKVTLASDAVSFELGQVGARFAGTLRGDAIAGTMSQLGQTIPFSIKRRAKDAYVPPSPPAEELAADAGAPLLGDWYGASDDLAIAATLVVDGGVVVGHAELGRSCKRTPVANLAFVSPHVHFEASGAYFDGELAGATITGTLHQGGAAKPFALNRGNTARPPYTEIEVTIESVNRVTLAGTLTVPDGVLHAPAVVLVTGSGPQDRDECVYGVRPFRQLADHLARHGIAALRYDDRGTASSTGDFKAATAVDFADDAEAAVRFLRARPEIDPKRVGVLGHSEGGLIAPMLAARTRDVAFIVLWAGPGLAMPEVDLQQTADMLRAEGATAAAIDTAVDHERRVIAALRAAKTEAELRTALHAIVADDGWVDGKVKENWSPWLRWYLDYDPAATLAKVRCPVLALNGGLDTQVAARTNLAAIKRALAGNPDVDIVELPGLNHLFQPTKTGALSEYQTNPPVLDPAVLEATTRWIARHVQ